MRRRGFVAATSEIAEAIEFHRQPERARVNSHLTTIVSCADQVCWKSGLACGYELAELDTGTLDDIWPSLELKFPGAAGYARDRYTDLLQGQVQAAQVQAAQELATARLKRFNR